MAAQFQKQDLLKAGSDGFAILDDIHGRRAKITPTPTPIPTPYYVYRVVMVINEPVIDSNQAPQFYGGTVIEYWI